VPVARDKPLPLSFSQQRIWLIQEATPESPAYNISLAWRLSGSLDCVALEKGLGALVQRHEIFRTRFVCDNGGHPTQVIEKSLALSLRVQDLQALPFEMRPAELEKRMRDEAAQPFDLTRLPLLRPTLYRLSADEHVFLVVLHHIIFDGWSVGVFVRELQRAYSAFFRKEAYVVPAPRYQYGDFAVWQRSWLQGETLAGQLAYWREKLSPLPPPLELPTDRPNPARRSWRGGVHRFVFSKELLAKIEALRKEEETTLHVVLLAGFSALLHRYTGQEDLAVGSPTANRTRSELRDAIGFFVNTQVLRMSVQGRDTFRGLIRAAKAVSLDAYANQDLPFDRLVDELKPERHAGQTPLFRVMLSHQHQPLPQLALPGLKSRAFEVDNGSAKFDLLLEFRERPEGLSGYLEYSTDLFEEASIRRMAEHLRMLLISAVENADRPLRTLPLLGEQERRRLVVEWNATRTDYPRNACIHQLFEEQVARTPEAIAVEFQEQRFTYAELNARANQLAYYLRSRGVGPESLVALLWERDAELIVVLLGILKAGGAYVPLDAAYPAERLGLMLADTQAGVLLTRRSLASRLPQHGARAVLLEESWREIAGYPIDNPVNRTVPDNLAYVMYTSGSTGRPKGVSITHRGVVRLVKETDYAALGPDGVFLQFAPISFDASTFEVWGCLLNGGRLVVFPPGTPSLEELGAVLIEKGVNTLWLTSALFQQMVERNLPALRGVRQLLAGGDVLPVAQVRKVLEELPQTQLINGYGPTESTTFTCCNPLRAQEAIGSSVPIGRPIANTRVYVLDGAMQPVPVGVPGELYIGGDGLARGYLNQPDMTAERFVPHPFCEEPGARLYRSGDLVRYLSDGRIEFLGRLDNQVKVRGFRIELGEIEAVLGTHPAVRENAVVAREEAPGDKRLVAYVVQQEGVQLELTGLRAFLKERLPDYMVPSAFVILARLPVTPNGKLDRRALPAPAEGRLQRGDAYLAPATPTERLLANIWAEVLGIDRVSRNDNFFELGGDSILGIQIAARARQAGLAITPSHVFEHQTISELAAAAPDLPSLECEQGLVTGEVPLTPVQRWFFEKGLLNPHYWNQAMLLELRRPIDTARLEHVFQCLVAHHDALRLRYRREPSGWYQINAGLDETGLVSRVDISGVPADEKARYIERIAAEAQASLNLFTGPLLRAVQIDLGPGQPGRLLIVIHHLAVDGVSWRILLEDLETACRQLEQGQAVHLPAKTTSFKSWAERVVAHVRSGALDAEAAYWQGLVSGHFAHLPVDFEVSLEANIEGSRRTVAVALTIEETDALLQDVPRAYRTQINDVLLTALARALGEWTGSSTFLIDLEGHGREPLAGPVDLSRTVGWFTSIFPVRLTAERSQTAGEALKSIKEQLRAIPNKGLGFGLARFMSEDPVQAGRWRAMPVPEMSFNYLGQFDQVLRRSTWFGAAPESTGPCRDGRDRRGHLIEIDGLISGGRLEFVWSYSASIHRRETIEQVARRYVGALRELIEHCRMPTAGGCTPSDFPLAGLDQATLDRLVGADRELADIYPLSPMQELFLAMDAPETGLGVEQWPYVLRGPLNVAALRRAWQKVVDRHSILRTWFASRGLRQPMQCVRSRVELPWEEFDWRALSGVEQQRRFEAFCRDDLDRGFDLSKPPLMRLVLIRTGEQTWQFIWTHHHIILDGWSWPVILREVRTCYAAFCRDADPDHELEPARPFREYISWLARQDMSRAEAFWRGELEGFTAPTRLTRDQGSGFQPQSAGGYADARVELSEVESETLAAVARNSQLALNTLVQGLWAFFVSAWTGEPDVVYGATAAGRPADLLGVESMVGLFINNLPVRARVLPNRSVFSWLADFQRRLAAWRRYDFTPLIRVQEWSSVPGHLRLFDSLVIYQNYEVPEASVQWLGPGMQVDRGSIPTRTNYPVSLTVYPGRRLCLEITYRRSCFDGAIIDHWLGCLKSLLLRIAASPTQQVSDLLGPLKSELSGLRARVAPAARGSNAPTRSRTGSIPAEALEQSLAGIWCELLGLPRVDVHSNFFELGGHSLVALQLLARIRKDLGVEVPTRVLFEAPTVSTLAARIAREKMQQAAAEAGRSHGWRFLTPVQPLGSRRPFFLFPGGIGGEEEFLVYARMACCLGMDQPFYGLQAPSPNGNIPLHRNVESMVSDYLEEIRAVQPEGPYALVGECIGGIVAYELARQLVRQGQRVALLALLDSECPSFAVRFRYWWIGRRLKLSRVGAVRMVLRSMGYLRGLWRVERGQRVAHLLANWRKGLRYLDSSVGSQNKVAPSLTTPMDYYYYRTLMRYKPKPYPGRVTLLISEELQCHEPAAGWKKWAAGGVDVHILPGTHLTYIRELVEAAANKLRACLDEAQADN
jgi:amino acid adenylation domain-containing protein/non-ribosomal peptide synthase protein (TIGR01720 family)